MKLILVATGCDIYRDYSKDIQSGDEFIIQPFKRPFTTESVKETMDSLVGKSTIVMQYFDSQLSEYLEASEVPVGLVLWDSKAIESQVGASLMIQQRNPEVEDALLVDFSDLRLEHTEVLRNLHQQMVTYEYSLARSYTRDSDLSGPLYFLENQSSLEL